MFSKFKNISFAFTILLAFSAVAFGQGLRGTIEGTITDGTGAVIPGATVTIESTGTTTGFKRTVTTDGNGFFLVETAPGTYKVTVSNTGFKSNAINVSVQVDRSASANMSLVPGSGPIEVDVSGDTAVTIDQSDTKIDTNITREVIDALPKGTTFGSLLKIAPNVRPEALGGGFQIDGASGSENVFVVDGQEVTNFRTGTLNSNNNLPFELLQEVQIKSTGFEAEYGGATGGVINAVTAGGNNDWHGNFGVSFRPAKIQGDRTPSLNRYGTGSGEFEYFNRPNDGGTNYYPVGSFSGPIVKDKFWGLLSYAPQIVETSRPITYFSSDDPSRTATDQQTINQTFKTEQAFARLDGQPISNLRMFGTFLWNPIIQDGALPATTAGLSSSAPTQSVATWAEQGGRQNSNAVNGQVTYTPTNWNILNFRIGRSFLNQKLGSYAIPIQTRFRCIVGDGVNCNSGFSSVPTVFANQKDVSTRTTFDLDSSFVGVNAGGRHNIKVGFQYNRLYNDVKQGYPEVGETRIWYGFTIIDFIGSRGGAITTDPTAIGAGYFQRFGTVGSASSTNQAVYAQDSWQIADRLTLNFGIRVEKEIVPSFGAPQTTENIEFNWGDKPAPRFGAAFDLTGDGKTKLFASYGWFYDRFKYELPRGSFGGDFFRRDYFEVLPSRGTAPTVYTAAAVLGNNTDAIGGTCPTTGSGWSQCQFDFRIATNSTTADIFSTGAVDPDIKAARQQEYTFGLERELGSNFVVAGRYTHKQIDRAVEDVGVFNDQGSEAYIIGNPGLGLVCEISTSANQPCTKAIREYDAVEVRVDKRAANYFFNASYTWSKLFGNYSGLASSDEGGRTSPNVNRFFDLPMLGYNANGVPDDGRLATDRPHAFKAFGGFSHNWSGNDTNRTSFSAFTTIQSGTPLTSIYSLYNVGTSILYGRGDLGRTDMFTETDFNVSHRYKFGRDNAYTFEAFIDLRNLFDENNELRRQTSVSGTNFTASTLTANGCTTCADEAAVFDTIFNQGGIQSAVVNFLNNSPVSSSGNRNDYDQSTTFQAGRDIRFGFRFFF